MKTKNKTLVLLEITVVLYSMLLVATLSGIAAEQTTQEVGATITTASEDDYTLDIYGNANEDDTIDMRDVTYTKLVIFGKKPETKLADAYFDDEVDVLDVVQIKLIILGRESELTLRDSADRTVTVKKPVERIIAISSEGVETMRSLKATDKIVGVSKQTLEEEIFFSEFSDYPCAGPGGWGESIDAEAILALEPDVVFLFASYQAEGKETLEDVGVTVFGFDYCRPGNYAEEVKKTGYIVGKREESAEFFEFYDGVMNTIKDSVDDIPEDKRPSVYFELYRPYYTCGKEVAYHQDIEMAGGNNIFGDLAGFIDVDREEVIRLDPEFILKHAWYECGYGVDDPTELRSVRDEIRGRSELAGVTAVKDKKVYVICGELIASAEDFIGIAYMAKWFHPELFEDLDPHAIHQEYITEFQGLDLDLDEHGVFVYHPVEHPDGY